MNHKIHIFTKVYNLTYIVLYFNCINRPKILHVPNLDIWNCAYYGYMVSHVSF
jgi:hypothetical protein